MLESSGHGGCHGEARAAPPAAAVTSDSGGGLWGEHARAWAARGGGASPVCVVGSCGGPSPAPSGPGSPARGRRRRRSPPFPAAGVRERVLRQNRQEAQADQAGRPGHVSHAGESTEQPGHGHQVTELHLAPARRRPPARPVPQPRGRGRALRTHSPEQTLARHRPETAGDEDTLPSASERLQRPVRLRRVASTRRQTHTRAPPRPRGRRPHSLPSPFSAPLAAGTGRAVLPRSSLEISFIC